MKIAFVAFSPQFVQYTVNLLNGLKDREHDVRIFVTHKLPKDAPCEYLNGFIVRYDRWSWFEIDSLKTFDPDLVLLWNGYAPWTFAAMNEIKGMFPVLHIERGWLPQRDCCYIADDLAAHSTFITDVPKNIAVNKAKIDELKNLYKPRYTDHSLPDKFIFFPAQLDEDTSITISSPAYKTCDSLIGDLVRRYPDYPIFVKNHPLSEDKQRNEKINLYTGPLSSLDLCSQASVVVGLTSTVLTEALVYKVPVVSFGYNVASPAHVSSVLHGPGNCWKAISDIMEGRPHYKSSISSEEMLTWLLSKQWSVLSPEEWVYDYIERWPNHGRA